MRKIIPLLSVCCLIILGLVFAVHNGQAQNKPSGIIDHFTDGDGFYKSKERAAKSAMKGVWQDTFIEPYQWRKQNK